MKKGRNIRVGLLEINVAFSTRNMSSTNGLCSTLTPAASANVVTVSLFRLMSAVSCTCSRFACSIGDVTGDEIERCCSSCTCILDCRCPVFFMLQSPDPTCGCGNERNLTSVWLDDWSVRVPSELV